MGTELLSSFHHLVADNSEATTLLLQSTEKLGNSVVRTRGVERVLHIMLAESCKGGFKLRILLTLRNSPFHEFTHTVAHKATDVINGVLGHIVFAEGIVHRIGKILQGVKQCTVKVENIYGIH